MSSFAINYPETEGFRVVKYIRNRIAKAGFISFPSVIN
jgi:hypothetical protein